MADGAGYSGQLTVTNASRGLASTQVHGDARFGASGMGFTADCCPASLPPMRSGVLRIREQGLGRRHPFAQQGETAAKVVLPIHEAVD